MLSLFRWKDAHEQAERLRDAGWLHRAVHRLTVAYGWVSLLMFHANVFVAPAAVFWSWRAHGWRGGLAGLAAIIAIDAVVIAGGWVLNAVRRRAPWLFLIEENTAAFDRDHPDLVVVLRSGRQPGSTVPAFAELRPW